MAPQLCLVCLTWAHCRYCSCKGPWYCSSICQYSHWDTHKYECAYRVAKKILWKKRIGPEHFEFPKEIIDEIMLGFLRKC